MDEEKSKGRPLIKQSVAKVLPETPVAVPPQQVPEDISETKLNIKKPKKWFYILIFALILVVLLAGGASAYYFLQYKPNRPDTLVKTAFANSTSVSNKPLSFDLEISLPAEGTINIIGGMDTNENMRAKITSSTLGPVMSMVVRSQEEKLYVKFNDALAQTSESTTENATFTQYLQELAMQLGDGWLQIDTTQTGIETYDTSIDLNEYSNLMPSYFDFNELENMYSGLVEVLEFKHFGNDTINGQSTKKIAISVDEDKLNEYFSNMFSSMMDTTIETYKQLYPDIDIESQLDFDTSDINSMINFDGILPSSTYVWVTPDQYIKKFQMTLNNDPIQAVISLELGNEAVDTSAPEEYTSIDSLSQDALLNDFINQMMSEYYVSPTNY